MWEKGRVRKHKPTAWVCVREYAQMKSAQRNIKYSFDNFDETNEGEWWSETSRSYLVQNDFNYSIVCACLVAPRDFSPDKKRNTLNCRVCRHTRRIHMGKFPESCSERMAKVYVMNKYNWCALLRLLYLKSCHPAFSFTHFILCDCIAHWVELSHAITSLYIFRCCKIIINEFSSFIIFPGRSFFQVLYKN